jgi:formylglycine-generating enzyme required for sulfatase activity
MKLVQAATFEMGSPEEEEGHREDETIRRVTLTRGFMIGVAEVTQDLWTSVMGSNPSGFKECGGTCPVESVSWCEAVVFANALSSRDGLRAAYFGVEGCETTKAASVSWDRSADGYRLPTEAEWEMAARAGQSLPFSGDANADVVAWHKDNSDDATHPVCTKTPNAWGLCDMSGNVWEWTWEWKAEVSGSELVDPSGAMFGKYKSARGGSMRYEVLDVRVARRIGFAPNAAYSGLGLRLVRTAP